MTVNDIVQRSSCHDAVMEWTGLQSEAPAIFLAGPAHIHAHSSQGGLPNRETCRRIRFRASGIWRETQASVGRVYVKETVAKAWKVIWDRRLKCLPSTSLFLFLTDSNSSHVTFSSSCTPHMNMCASFVCLHLFYSYFNHFNSTVDSMTLNHLVSENGLANSPHYQTTAKLCSFLKAQQSTQN